MDWEEIGDPWKERPLVPLCMIVFVMCGYTLVLITHIYTPLP
jgi:hypothetical protein